jgi:DNA gyrase/topoisomerase IV subunit A
VNGQKVEDYENRIANLEYQIELLKIQGVRYPGGGNLSLLVYNALGQVLRVELDSAELTSASVVARFAEGDGLAEMGARLLATSTQDELLFVFDTGRSAKLPVSAIPAVDKGELDWGKALLHEPRAGEELVMVLPIAKMSLFDFAVQASRRGYAKKIQEASLETYIANDYIGAGVILPVDRSCSLNLCAKDDRAVLVSWEGFLVCVEVSRLPFNIEEVLRMSASDHIVTVFRTGKKTSLLVMTQIGRIIHREMSWLEPVNSFKTHGQAVFSQARREAGVRVVGAAAVEEKDWGALLVTDGGWSFTDGNLSTRGRYRTSIRLKSWTLLYNG